MPPRDQQRKPLGPACRQVALRANWLLAILLMLGMGLLQAEVDSQAGDKVSSAKREAPATDNAIAEQPAPRPVSDTNFFELLDGLAHALNNINDIICTWQPAEPDCADGGTGPAADGSQPEIPVQRRATE